MQNPDEYTIKDFANKIKALTGSRSTIVTLQATADDPHKRKPDITTATTYLGWKPAWDVEDGLRQTVDYFKREISDEFGGRIVPTGPEASRPSPM